MKTNVQKIIPIIILVMLVHFVPVCLAEESGPTTWHQFQKDIAHTGFYPETLPEAYGELWNASVDAVGDSAPVVAEGMVFVNCFDNKLKAINISTGIVEWSTPVDRIQYGSWSSPAYHDGKVFTSTGFETTCVYANNGTKKWVFKNPVDASCNGGPMIADGMVFCNDWNEMHYYCLYESNGTKKWEFKVDNAPSSKSYAQGTAAYRDGMVYLTCWDYHQTPAGYVYCVYATNGSEKWNSPLGSCCGSPALGDNNLLYVTAFDFDGKPVGLSALNMTDGAIKWQTDIKASDSTPAIAYGNVYVSSANNIYCVNATNGSIVWHANGAGGWTDSVSVADGKVFAGIQVSSMGTKGFKGLVEFDAYTGDMLWRTRGGSTAISDGNIYSIGDGHPGKVYAYSAATPTIDIITDNVELPTGNAYPYYPNEITATISNDGNLYVENVNVFFKVNDMVVDSQTISLLGGACSQSVNFDWTPAEPGNYAITIEASADGITETSPSNNAMSIDIEAKDGNPDLVPSGIVSAVYVNQPYELKTTVSNTGYKAADSFLVEIKEGTTVLATETVSSLGPAQSTDVVFNWLPAVTGNVDLTITVDSSGVIVEEEEGNNELIQSVEVKPETSVEILSGDDWSQFQCNSSNNGVTNSYSPCDGSVRLKWSADDFDGYVDIPPIVVGDMVYVLSSNGSVFAYDKYAGTYEDGLGWSMFTNDIVDIQSSTLAYGDGNIFVATHNGNLYAYNFSSGKEQWTVNVTNQSFESPITYYDHRIYIGDCGVAQGHASKYFYCYDDLGTLLWKHQINDTAGFLWGGSFVVDDYVVLPVYEGKLISLNRKTGELADEINLTDTERIPFAKADPGYIRASVMYNDGYAYMTSEIGQSNGYVWKIGFNSASGTFSGQGWCSEQIFSTSTPVVYEGKVYVGQGEHGASGELICLDDSNGNELWSYGVPSGVKSSPVVSTYYDTLYIYFTSAMEDGSLYCLDGDGNPVWEYNPPDDGYILQGVAVSQGRAYFGTDGGYLYCVGGDKYLWNDPDSSYGQRVDRREILSAVASWKYHYVIPETNEIVGRTDITSIVTAWKQRFPMRLYW